MLQWYVYLIHICLSFLLSTIKQPTNAPTSKPLPLTIFVTSQAYQGNLGGLLGANRKCQNLANNAGLKGTYRAWISQSASSSPAQSWSQANPRRPYYLVDGTTKVADDWNHLTSTVRGLYHPINKNENGRTVTGTPLRAWTNTRRDGSRVSTDNCDAWSRSNILLQSKYGGIAFTNNKWSWEGQMNCALFGRLYCFQQNTSA